MEAETPDLGRRVQACCPNGMRKVKAQLGLSMARDSMNNKKGFYRNNGQKIQARESVPPLIDKKGDLVTAGMEEPEVLNNFFALVFTVSQAPHVS